MPAHRERRQLAGVGVLGEQHPPKDQTVAETQPGYGCLCSQILETNLVTAQSMQDTHDMTLQLQHMHQSDRCTPARGGAAARLEARVGEAADAGLARAAEPAAMISITLAAQSHAARAPRGDRTR